MIHDALCKTPLLFEIEERFGWGKTVGTAAKTMLRGTARVGFQFALNMIACNLVRLPGSSPLEGAARSSPRR